MRGVAHQDRVAGAPIAERRTNEQAPLDEALRWCAFDEREHVGVKASKFLQEFLGARRGVPSFLAPAIAPGDADDVDQSSMPDQIAIEDPRRADENRRVALTQERRCIAGRYQTTEGNLSREQRR
jgi:hypothetical protein